MEHSLQRLKRTLDAHHRALEELESALLECEESIRGEAQEHPQERRGLELLSISELCQELGMGKSWIYRRLRSGEIPSVKNTSRNTVSGLRSHSKPWIPSPTCSRN
jgi:excisionase family DNA binding protein